MYWKVREYIRRYEMLEQGDRIIAGVSGGADSICLLFMLIEFVKETGCSVVAAHVHHGLRGEAADADAAYVEKVCKEQGIRCRVFREDVKSYAGKRGLTIEEAGRDVRRECFRKVMEEEYGTKVALAHHQDDNAETLIWNLCRGCGIKGLGGIAPVAGVFIRPLLCLRREEIETYLKERKIAYCVDETNLEEDYTRNRIRRHVMPYLEECVNSRSVVHMSEAMEQARMLGTYVEQEIRRYMKKSVQYREDGRLLLDRRQFCQIPEALRSNLLHELLCHVAGRRKDIEMIHIRMLEELLEKQVGRQVNLPYGICAVRCYEGVEFFVLPEKRQESPERGPVSSVNGSRTYRKSMKRDEDREIILAGRDGAEELPWPADCQERQAGRVRWRVFDKTEDMRIFPKKPYTKWFDYDIIKNTVKIRHREPGDYITITRSGGTQKLKQYFINEKVPGEIRDRIWLAADGQHIMWIAGYRQNQMYQITDKTRRILEIEFDGG